MTNKEIARSFRLLAKLMEMQGENPYKIRSYESVAGLISKLGTPLSEMTPQDIDELKGVGSAISAKIQELLTVGKMKTLERYKGEVPEGIQEMLQIKGLGARKVRSAWEELGVENATELLYACNENRLIELKGFGAKTQEEIRKQLEFFLSNRQNFLYASIEATGLALLDQLREANPWGRWEVTGAFRRKEPILDKLEYLVEDRSMWPGLQVVPGLVPTKTGPDQWEGIWGEQTRVVIYRADSSSFGSRWLQTTGPESILSGPVNRHYATEAEAFKARGKKWIPPECRHDLLLTRDFPERILEEKDIRGVVHAHSTFSDGVHTIGEMASYSREKGYSYLVITDHSQIAVYADGMDEAKIIAQWAEIDRLNSEDPAFRIVKGIECDILNDGDLDYSDEQRAGFECVLASIHTNIRMDEEKATSRLIKAVEHPHTNMIGHPTGRLLLGRNGYPLDMRKVIDACAANQVAIEINASPYRLDLDWTHIGYAVERGVKLSVNPDAHGREFIDDIRFGVIIARKGWLPVESCLNALSVDDFLRFCKK